MTSAPVALEPRPSPAPSPTSPRRAAWLWVLGGGVLAYLLTLRTLTATDNPNFVPSLILLGSVVVPATVLVFAASNGRRVLAPPGLIALVAVLGGVLGTVAAGTLEFDAMQRLGVLPMFAVGLIEESAKLVVPLVVLICVRPRDPRIGVIVGVASGMGFATLETMGYAFHALLTSGSLHAVDQTLLLRALLAPAGHVAWTGLVCAALWAVPGSTSPARSVGRLLAVFAAAVLLHTAWDGSRSLLVHGLVALVSSGALLLVIRRAHRSAPAVEGDSAPAALT